jgi:hypothetical protein
VLEQQGGAAAEQVHRRLEAGDQAPAGHGAQLAVVEPLPVLLEPQPAG